MQLYVLLFISSQIRGRHIALPPTIRQWSFQDSMLIP